MEDENELDFTKLKYALYARKSTTDETRQVRSIQDQVYECKELADRLNLHIIGAPLRETKSAKKPHQRPIFRKMINDIKNGIYDGILAWNPDRLARNMLEGGEIIDLIDQGIIKDLKFVTHHFTKDANGKMLLGMAFVLSKQYSDDLSQKVTRGVRRRLGEGKTAVPKHGYINEGGIYQPDAENFDLICRAWQMRKNGISIVDITEYLNGNGYSRTIKATGKKVDMDMRILSGLFHDPFYYGVLVQAGQQVDLRQLYDFIPAVSEEDYWIVQKLDYHRIKPSKPHKLVFYPFRQMVQCAFCGENMVIGPSTSATGKRYLNFRCDNKNCIRKKKSIRAKVVVDFIYNKLHKGLNFTESEYKKYLQNITSISDIRREGVRGELYNRRGVLKRITDEIRERSLKIVNFKDGSRVWQENFKMIDQLTTDEVRLSGEVSKLENQLGNKDTDRLSIEQFLNLSRNAERIVQSANAIIKDQITRLIFLNFTVDEEKVTNYRLKEPFATLLKQREVLSSRSGRN